VVTQPFVLRINICGKNRQLLVAAKSYFDTFRKQTGLNNFNLTPRKWVEATDAIGIVSKSGRSGGTFAHKDIAFEFATWLNPSFKLYLIKEYQRLKEVESNQYNL
jgi:hypothetical protein